MTDGPREWVKEISYKPRWRFEIVEAPHEAYVYLGLFFDADDAYKPGYWTVVQGATVLPPPALTDRGAFFSWVRHQISAAENHEIDEWFKVSGVRVRDPHKTPLTPRL